MTDDQKTRLRAMLVLMDSGIDTALVKVAALPHSWAIVTAALIAAFLLGAVLF